MDNFSGANGEYQTSFSLKSEDKKNSHDNYLFKIIKQDYNQTKLFEIGTRINADSLKITDPKQFFSGKDNCEIHAELSLTNTSRNKASIFIVTEIPPERMLSETDKTKKYLIFEAIYNGTVKDSVFTNVDKNIFLREQ